MNFDTLADWHLTHLIFLDPDWQANIADEHHVAIGTGDTPEAAISAANAKALTGDVKTKFEPLTSAAPSTRLVDLLRLGRDKPTIIRRALLLRS